MGFYRERPNVDLDRKAVAEVVKTFGFMWFGETLDDLPLRILRGLSDRGLPTLALVWLVRARLLTPKRCRFSIVDRIVMFLGRWLVLLLRTLLPTSMSDLRGPDRRLCR